MLIDRCKILKEYELVIYLWSKSRQIIRKRLTLKRKEKSKIELGTILQNEIRRNIKTYNKFLYIKKKILMFKKCYVISVSNKPFISSKQI